MKTLVWTLLLISPFLSLKVQAVIVVKELEAYKRCHYLITNTYPTNRTIISKIKSRELTAEQACSNILKSISFDNGSGFVTENGTSLTPLSKKVLKTFNNLHRTWFPESIIRSLHNCGKATEEFIDIGEGALFFTKALLDESVEHKTVVTADSSYDAVRESAIQNEVAISRYGSARLNRDNLEIIVAERNSGVDTDAYPDAYKSIPASDIEPIAIGEFLGIKPMVARQISRDPASTSIYQTYLPTDGIDLTKSFGAGVLGTVSFLMATNNYGDNAAVNGASSVQRGWSKTVLDTFLCKTGEPLRFEDVTVQEDVTDKTPAFREDISCQRCHSSLDPLAGVIRNIRHYRSVRNTCAGNSNRGEALTRIAFSRKMSTTKSAHPDGFMADPDSNYMYRPTEGRLTYRDYDGNLIKIDLNNLEELGEALSGNNDFYACSVNKYLNYFTGLEVSLNEIPPQSRGSYAKDYLELRRFVISEGLKLKEHQNVKKTISNIMKSKYFKK
ncbi:MAG: hypothetical protein ACPGJV_04145 [Bacteriovoracaceae bacterium]